MPQDMDWAECELAGYQRGFILVRFDFAHSVLIWKDSNRWFNNFVRGLPREVMAKYRELIDGKVAQLKQETSCQSDGPHQNVWHLRYGKSGQDAEFTLTGSDVESVTWKDLKSFIETAGDRSFEL